MKPAVRFWFWFISKSSGSFNSPTVVIPDFDLFWGDNMGITWDDNTTIDWPVII